MRIIKPRRESLAAAVPAFRVCGFQKKNSEKTATKQRAFRCYFRSRTFGSPGFSPKMRRCPLQISGHNSENSKIELRRLA